MAQNVLAGFFQPGQNGSEFRLAQGQVFNPPNLNQTLSELHRSLALNPFLLNDLESDLSLVYALPNRLVLIRDACGATPLFVARHQDGWAYGFDLASLFAVLGRVPDLNEEAYYDFLATHYRHIFRDPQRTFHEGVLQIPAGHYAVIDENGLSIKPWLDLSFEPSYGQIDVEAASDLYLSILKENVSARLKALEGQKLAFSISSGLDSSTVASLAAQKLGRLNCFFVAYKDDAQSPYDESEGVKAITNEKGWALTRLDLGAPDLLAETRALLAKTQAPIITVTWLAHYVLARSASQSGYERLFSGLGGDESLAGEFEHFFVYFADLKKENLHERLKSETDWWIERHNHPVFRKSPEVRDQWFARNLDFATGQIKVDQIRYGQNQRFFNPEWIKAMEEKIPPIPMPRPYPYFLSNRLFQEMSYETSPPTLWSESLSSAAGGIKGVFPMASPKLFRLAYSLPGTYKYDQGLTKQLIRRGSGGLLPESTRWNPVKTGFNAPLDLWLKNPKLASEVLELLESGPLSQKGWLKKGAAKELVESHQKGEANHMMVLWPLIVTALLLDLQKNQSLTA
ncbi:MAG: asparagine synthase [Deltaproteobacteria bacterium]|jgi:asparagine synthase (glutamine-hydrolysing)|nr:asparagine synthase [Deltaproteobacteria bacterium]